MFRDAVTGSDEWVANRLAKMLRDRNRGSKKAALRLGGHLTASTLTVEGRPGLDVLWDYFRGEPPLPWCPDGWSAAVAPYLRMSRLNLAEMTVMSAVDCMTPLAWGTAVDSDADGDQEAHRIASQNDLPLQITDVAQSMLLHGDGYALLGPSVDGEVPRITAEDARSCITREDPITGETTFGMKLLVDEWTGEDAWYLYGPGWVRKAVIGKGGRRWVAAAAVGGFDTGRARIPGHGDWCAMHRVSNRGGVGEFERHLSVLDRVNDGIFGRIVVAKFQAHRQRGIKGLPDTETDPITGEERDIDYSDAFLADPGSLWRLPEGSEIWESTPVDLGPIRLATLDDIKHVCALTSSPIYYLFPDEQQSAAGAGNQSQAHETRVLDRRARMDGFQARLLAHAFEAMGDMARADASRLRTEWGPVRRLSAAEQAQLLPAFTSGGVPWEERMLRVLQVRPADIPRMSQLRARDMLFMTPPAPRPAGAVAT